MAKYHILGLFALLFLTHSILAAEVKLGPEVPLSSKIELRAATGAQLAASVASNGRDFIAVWLDSRRQSDDVLVTRIGTDGRPANLIGRKIAEGAAPKIASAGGDYVAVWGTATLGAQSVRLDENGVPVTNARTVNFGSPRALVSNGANYLLVLANGGVLLDRDGARLWSAGKNFSNPFGAGVHGGRYVVVDAPGTLLRTIADDGSVSDVLAPVSIPPGDANNPEGTAAFSPNAILIAWNSGSYAVVGYDGSVIRTVTALPGLKAKEHHASAGWDGHQFLLSLSGQEAFRITSDGTLLDAAPFTLSPGEPAEPVFASNGATQLVVWSEAHPMTAQDLVGRAVPDFDALAATPGPAMPLTYSGTPQKNVRVARSSTGVFGVWTDDSYSTLWGTFNGTQVTIDANDSIDAPAIAAGSRVFLVAWRRTDRKQNDRLVAKRFDFSGKDLDPQPLTLSVNSSDPFPDHPQASIAFDGSAFLIAWTNDKNLNTIRVGEEEEPFGARETVLAADSFHVHSPRAFWTGSQFFVGYTVVGPSPFPHDIGGKSAISAIRFDHGDAIQQPTWIYYFLGSADVRATATLGDGNVTFAWVNDTGFRIEALEANADTAVQKYFAVPVHFTQWPVPTKIVEIGWNGAEFVLIWSQRIGREFTLRGMRLDATLTPIDSEPFDIASPVDGDSSPSVIRTPTGVLIGYSRIDAASGDSLRAFTRALDRNSRPPHRRAVGR